MIYFLHRKAKSLGVLQHSQHPLVWRPCTHTEWLASIFSLVPRPSPAPVFGRLQYEKTEPEASEDWLSFCMPELGRPETEARHIHIWVCGYWSATEVVCVYLAAPQTGNLILMRGYNCGCCLLDAGNFVDVAMVTVVSYYQSLWVLVHTQTQLFAWVQG